MWFFVNGQCCTIGSHAHLRFVIVEHGLSSLRKRAITQFTPTRCAGTFKGAIFSIDHNFTYRGIIQYTIIDRNRSPCSFEICIVFVNRLIAVNKKNSGYYEKKKAKCFHKVETINTRLKGMVVLQKAQRFFSIVVRIYSFGFFMISFVPSPYLIINTLFRSILRIGPLG